MSDTQISPEASPGEVVVIQPGAEVLGRHRMPYFVGVSEATSGARGISMSLVVIPPGGSSQPHIHKGHESAIYLLKGKINMRYGPGLSQSKMVEQGNFMFVPADLPHQPVNQSDTEPVHLLVARNEPNEQESIVPYDPAGGEA